MSNSKKYPISKSEADWRKELTPNEFHILREKGTEHPFSGKYNNHFKEGIYKCICCGNELFQSDHKFKSNSGWPSFFQSKDTDATSYSTDESYGMIRTEVRCKKCGAHLGHLFEDGPKPSGKRYCINSVSLSLDKLD